MICITQLIKNRDEKKIVDDDGCEKDYINFLDFITPNHYIGRKSDNVMLK